MDPQSHWEKIYQEKASDAVSWYRPHLEKSLALIEALAPQRFASIIDVGGGESTLVDDLLARGYQNITVVGISPSAIDANRKRLGNPAQSIHWLVADITQNRVGAIRLRCVARPPRRVSFPYLHQRSHRLRPPGRSRGQTRRPCNREHLWPRGANQV